MARLLKELDELLRGDRGRSELLARGTEHLKPGPYTLMSVVLGAIYGLSMALYAVLSRTPPAYQQFLASAAKVPALFFLSLLVSFPSLYVFSALLEARLSPLDILRLIVAAVTVNLAVLASFAPITAFFTFTTNDYHFIKLLNVLFFAIAGGIGMAFLMKMLQRLDEARRLPAPELQGSAQPMAELQQTAGTASARTEAARSPAGRAVFKVWIAAYALVQVQMAWLLRPFIGAPNLPFTWFRPRGGSAFLDILRTLVGLFR